MEETMNEKDGNKESKKKVGSDGKTEEQNSKTREQQKENSQEEELRKRPLSGHQNPRTDS
jgi:hypothetical protein